MARSHKDRRILSAIAFTIPIMRSCRRVTRLDDRSFQVLICIVSHLSISDSRLAISSPDQGHRGGE